MGCPQSRRKLKPPLASDGLVAGGPKDCMRARQGQADTRVCCACSRRTGVLHVPLRRYRGAYCPSCCPICALPPAA